jgi:hypothetical protein
MAVTGSVHDKWTLAVPLLSVVAVAVAFMVGAGAELIVVRLDDVRLLWAIGLVLAVLFLSFWSVPAVMLLVLWWLPLMGFVRRLFDTLRPVEFDPLLAIAPSAAMGLAALAFYRFRGSLGGGLRTSRPTLVVTLLAFVLALHVVVRLLVDSRAGLTVGLFLFGPLLWYFLGRAHLDGPRVRRLLTGSVVVGTACGLFGLYQAFVGFLPMEEEWIARKIDQFRALQVGSFIRPFSTFPNPEEWSRYMAVVGTVALGFIVLGRRGRGWWALAFAVSTAAIVVGAVRTSVFGYVVSLGVLLVLTASTRGTAVCWIGLLAGAFLLFVTLAPALSGREVEASRVAWLAFVGHTVRGVRMPLEEDSLMVRLDIWRELFTDVIPRNPLGMGPTNVTESYAVTLFVDTGIPGGLLFVAFLMALAGHARRLFSERREVVAVIVTAALAGMAFTSFLGNSLALYSIGPLGWSLAGWLSTQNVRGDRGR